MQCQDCSGNVLFPFTWIARTLDIASHPMEIELRLCSYCYDARAAAAARTYQEEQRFLDHLSTHPRFKQKSEVIEEPKPGFFKRIANKVFRRKNTPKSKFRSIPIVSNYQGDPDDIY